MTMEITVEVKKVNFTKDAGKKRSWRIITTDIGTIKGVTVWEPGKGEKIDLVGDWGAYKGQKEFKFTSACPSVPEDGISLLNYACILTPGFGEKKFKKIWDSLGNDWRLVFNGSDVDGISRKDLNKLRETVESLERKKGMTKAITYLLSIGCTVKTAEKAWEKWEMNTVGIVNDNCYALTEIKNVGFGFVDDKPRKAFGIELDDPRRIKAGIFYSIKMLQAQTGYTLFSWQDIAGKSQEVLRIDASGISGITKTLFDSGELVPFPESKHVAMKNDYLNELTIMEFLK